MRVCGLLLTGILTCASLFAQSDPFVGTWVYSAQKSPKPTIKYAIKDLGGDRYVLTGSTGTSVELKADGVSIKTDAGATVSFQKLDNHDWKMVRDEGQKMIRTYNISTDDKTLTLHDVFTGGTGDNFEMTTKYARLTPGKSIFGEWQSVSMEEKANDEGLKLIINPFGGDGLSLSMPAHKHLSELKFDGKMYPDSGSGDAQGASSTGKRISARALHTDGFIKGEVENSENFTVSDDGKTLTIVSSSPKSSSVFTMIWDKQ